MSELLLSPVEPSDLGHIADNAKKYELVTLVRVLEKMGIPRSCMHFESRRIEGTPEAPRGIRQPVKLGARASIVEGIAYHADGLGRLHATLWVNTGLFGPRSPLPGYFQELLTRDDVGEALGSLLHVLDDAILRTVAVSTDPSNNSALQPENQQKLGAAIVKGSPEYVEWTFRQAFPELRVEVRRAKSGRPLRINRVALGVATLGSCALNGTTTIRRSSLEVLLTVRRHEGDFATKGARGRRVETWSEEVMARLHDVIFPHFRDHPMTLRVSLRMLTTRLDAQVGGARVNQSLVVEAQAPTVITLFSGDTSDARV